MATNMTHRGDPYIALPLAVASGTVAGDVVAIGTGGLTGYVKTDRATTALIAAGTAAPGLADGQASVELIGVGLAVNLTVDSTTSVVLGQPVYKVTADASYSDDPAGAIFIGYALATILDGATGLVGLSSAPVALGS